MEARNAQADLDTVPRYWVLPPNSLAQSPGRKGKCGRVTSWAQTVHNPVGRYSKQQVLGIFQAGAHSSIHPSVHSTTTGFMVDTVSNARALGMTVTQSLLPGDDSLAGEIDSWTNTANASWQELGERSG